MAIGGMTPYGPVGRDPYARIETVRPIERRKDESDADTEEPPRAPQPPARPPEARPGTGRLVDLFV